MNDISSEVETWNELKSTTGARIDVGRAGTRPLTSNMLRLRLDHAAAIDAVYSEVPRELIEEMGLLSVNTLASDKVQYLKRPDLGRRFTTTSADAIQASCLHAPQVQIVVSDGLSAAAIEANLKEVYSSLLDSLNSLGLEAGTPIYVERGRVGSMDHIGDILQPEVLVLLIGERPGLLSASSMSAYMCYKPCIGKLDSDRNVISNIHESGTPPAEAGARIASMLKAMLDQRRSGTELVF
ncbi:ethanolamine ammonia-lyase subunit EutC [Paenibacillus glycanilyticus]|nr:ethanolamine ammonia-lyase subunit EutC [Paenibacillus glycanilyticus]